MTEHATFTTTKVCPECGCDQVISLHGSNTKMCCNCAHEYPWPLEEDQTHLWDNTPPKLRSIV